MTLPISAPQLPGIAARFPCKRWVVDEMMTAASSQQPLASEATVFYTLSLLPWVLVGATGPSSIPNVLHSRRKLVATIYGFGHEVPILV